MEKICFDVFIVNSNSKYLGKKLSKEDLKRMPIYTLKKFSSAYQNLVNVLEYKSNENINIKNITYSGIIELLKIEDIIAVITQEYVQDELARNELCILDIDLKLELAEYGIYYNVNNKSKKLNNLIDIFKGNCKI